MPSPPETIAASVKRTALRGSEKTSLRGDWPQCMQCVQAPLPFISLVPVTQTETGVLWRQMADLVSPEIQESGVREWLSTHVGLEYHGGWFGVVKNKIVVLAKLLTNVFLSSCTLMAGLVLGSFREPTERGKLLSFLLNFLVLLYSEMDCGCPLQIGLTTLISQDSNSMSTLLSDVLISLG